MDKDIGMTSRGYDDEQLFAIADALHAEQHAVEYLLRNPDEADKLAPHIDELRRIRQELVKVWSGDKVNPSAWCELKHLIELYRRAYELIEASSRVEPHKVGKLARLTRRIERRLQEAKRKFLSGNRSVDECPRCVADVDVLINNLEKIYETKNLNISLPKKDISILKNSNNESRGDMKMVEWGDVGTIALSQFAAEGVKYGMSKIAFLDKPGLT